ncbi:hypothetical protein Dimus_025957 [Dionaea muscipula]
MEMVVKGVLENVRSCPRSFEWDYLKEWLMKVARGESQKAKRIRHLFAAAIYCIWSERNARIFQASAEPSGSLVRKILQMG